ncbi:RtcB family protein [Auraticoccus monumenti]|uniref:3'-phosphate/5'-hydroxy nucleic acid ligase n=1 Tax=Auraticoccus monumenti TaxID=675864 RepID=A0A1G6V813_9ACTN|nr:RtcB family protein [Auraticoccus monumenti]SDD49594.1 tRNA-splicing ligase RtcB [Auraticoccus monumenti]
MTSRIAPKALSWASLLEDGTREQAVRTSTMPFIHPHLALMPDAHLGKGATVGSVIPTLGAIMPAAVGVDIGCGMEAVRTGWTADDLAGRDLSVLRRAIEDAVPLSAGAANDRLTDSAGTRVAALRVQAQAAGFDPAGYAPRWELQLGTLGSGNHFIEVSLDQEDRVWLFLHSGSRGVGNKIAQHHIGVARDLMKRWWISLPDPDLAYLVAGTPEFDHYLAELHWAQDYARENRAEMVDRVAACTAELMGAPVEVTTSVSCHHNYTAQERHFGREVLVSRKGAISAREGEWGLVPGSMGTRSYVVQGLGNPVALHSAPHGAGRAHSRAAARRTFTREQLREAMAGIEYRDSDAFIDEIPAAYKDIEQVMADAADLVEVRFTLRQVVNVKGD